MKLNNLNKFCSKRKELRKTLTPAEAKLWTYLKQSQLEGRKFRRQHSIGNYILDFYCPSEFLAIELDGETHNNDESHNYDKIRDLFLLNFGIRVLRFENKFVFKEPEWLLMTIANNFGWFIKNESQ